LNRTHIEAKPRGKGHLYRLTAAGEDLMRRQICPAEIPVCGSVIRFDFRGIPKGNRSPRYCWLVLRPDERERVR